MQNITKYNILNAVSALRHRNYRLFWFGQCISLIGTWIQNIAQSWLVLEITKSAFWLGVISAVQFLPMLCFSLYAGTLVDRLPKRKALIFTQISFMMLSLILGIDVYLDNVKLWHIVILAGMLGIINTLDAPSRQSIIVDLVGKEDLMNAIVLNSSIYNAAKVLGPSIGGIAIASLGMDICFFLNTISYIPVIIGILLMTVDGAVKVASRHRKSIIGEMKIGIRYVLKTPEILIPIMLMVVINIFAMNLTVIVPLFAKNVFKAGASGFGFLMAANGIGAFLASIVLAAKSSKGPKLQRLITASMLLGMVEILLATFKNYYVAYMLLLIIGILFVTFTTTANTLIQTKTPNHLRGRVMSIYSLVFGGMIPIGSFLTGSLANEIGPTLTLGLEATICIILVFAIILKNYEEIKEIIKV